MKLKSWKELEEGGVVRNTPTSLEYKTGDWRIKTPFFLEGECSQCLLCFLYCPDSAIKVKFGKVVGIDLDYCKGCGICANVCTRGAIYMKEEDI
ncbi:MAG: 4Fe-4S binding protein [Candidatus Hydrothermales bacterium]